MFLRFNGTKQSIEEWAADYGIPCKLIRSRLKRGWSVERAITEPMPVWLGEKLKAEDLRDKPVTPKVAPLAVPAPITYQPPLRYRSALRKSRFIQTAKLYEFNGQKLPLSQWADRLGISRSGLLRRIENGWTLDRALSVKPIRNQHGERVRGRAARLIEFDGETLTVKEWANRLGIAECTLNGRLISPRWTLERALTTGNSGTRRRACRPRPPIRPRAPMPMEISHH